ncbi:3-dehydroquinate synthase [Salinibius halmophilus]|uniref:3-dehydroquinate synthase n=1 Tax=Salinibius halmophilus TaxID=1853216 RepID=UPI000E67513E|nr:3-dehydroquinate synthase [Salinibius halmophilus]
MAITNVDLGERSYPIFIEPASLNQKDKLAPYIHGNQAMIVTNETIAPLYLDALQAALPFTADVVILPDGEAYKDLEHFNQILTALIEKRHSRKTTLIALGGGVVGDMTGFAAAAYQRGVNFIQVPTTLLSQVDSSVGGKTGVNHPLGKNMIGAFKQPQAVLIDPHVFRTLPERELSAGMAEVIKYGLIYDADFFAWLEANAAKMMALDLDACIYAIQRACEIKAEVVAKDETEQGIRAWLNLGHTFGHAIEAHMGYGQWLHGEAVAAGTMQALDLSKRLGWIDQTVIDRTQALFEICKLPVKPPAMTRDEFLKYMAVDKKVIDGTLRLVLLEQLGKATVTADFSAAQLNATLDETIA